MTKKITPLTQDDETRLADAVRASAQQIWQAGLGAFVKAQQEGGRAFTRLVKDGTELQKRARTLEDAGDTVARAAGRATRRASGSWGKLEQVFEERVARALAAIGVPALSDVEALEQRIGELEQAVAALAGAQGAAAPAPAPARKSGAGRALRAAAVKTAALKTTPVKNASAKAASAKASSAKAAPARRTPAKTAPARTATVKAAPAEPVPARPPRPRAPASKTAAKKAAAK